MLREAKVDSGDRASGLLQQTGTAAASVPVMNIVELAQKKMVDMGYGPMGPTKKGGLALYLGRFKDPRTKKLKTMKKPNYIFNKYDYQQNLDHSLLMLAYKWNQYIKAA